MDNSALILKNYGHRFTPEGKKFVFSLCPFCKTNSRASFNDSAFMCTNCTPDAIGIQELFNHLRIKVDFSPTDVKDLLEKNIDTLLDPTLKGFKTNYSKLD